MTIEVEDSLAKARESKALMQELLNILNGGNVSLVKAFGHLTTLVEVAAEEGDLNIVREGLELIDTLCDLGISVRPVEG